MVLEAEIVPKCLEILVQFFFDSQECVENLHPAVVYQLQLWPELLFCLGLQHLVVELEDLDSWVFVGLLQGFRVDPCHFPVLARLLVPVSEVLWGCQVFLQRLSVVGPVHRKFSFRCVNVLLHGLDFNLAKRDSLHVIRFLFPSFLNHQGQVF